MRKALAAIVLTGALAAATSAAFADDGVQPQPGEVPSIAAAETQTTGTAMAGEYHNPTNPFRQENMVQ